MDGLSRRDLVRTAALAGGALALTAAAGSSPAQAGSRRAPEQAQAFFADPDINFTVLYTYGACGYGAAELGEVVTITNRVNARGATYDAIYDEFSAYAERLRDTAEEALVSGRMVTARSRFLRAAAYYAPALFYVLGTRYPYREKQAYKRMNDCWTRAAGLFTPEFEPVEIPYENTTIPGWLLKPDASDTPRPTLIVTNGSDGQLIDIYAYGGAAAIERGWNALLYEGPGQGAMLFERGIPFRPDWEAVATPIVDYLLRRPDVDGDRIAMSGWSMAGELVGRAAAFEHRLAAVVLDPGVTDTVRPWRLPRQLVEAVMAGDRRAVNDGWEAYLAGATPEQRFGIAKRSEIFRPPDAFGLIQDLLKYRDSDVIHLITSPTLVIDYEQEQFYPGQARTLYDLLTAPKAYVEMTVAQGAQYHDAPMAPQWRNEVVFDWLEETLGS